MGCLRRTVLAKSIHETHVEQIKSVSLSDFLIGDIHDTTGRSRLYTTREPPSKRLVNCIAAKRGGPAEGPPEDIQLLISADGLPHRPYADDQEVPLIRCVIFVATSAFHTSARHERALLAPS